MRLALAPVPRCSRAVLLTLGVLATWGAGVLALEAAGSAVPLCRFHALTGLPCPSCGGTRGVAALLDGRLGAAFASNPLLLAALVTAALVLGVRLLTGRLAVLETRPGERRWVWGALTALVLADWAYLVVAGR